MQLTLGIERIRAALPRLYAVPQGGTAVGTGLNAAKGFDKAFVQCLKQRTKLPFTMARNKFEGMAAHDAMVEISGVYNVIARSEEHTSELQSLMRISYAVFCLKKKKNKY